jgi:tRNA (cytidine/uridine-2'-O-)-methyltransferase
MRLALFQPAIPQNVGACIRLGACFGVELHVIEPAGFRFDDRAMKRAALDYGPLGHMTRHADWDAFQRDRGPAGWCCSRQKAPRPCRISPSRPTTPCCSAASPDRRPRFRPRRASDARVVYPHSRPRRGRVAEPVGFGAKPGIALWEGWPSPLGQGLSVPVPDRRDEETARSRGPRGRLGLARRGVREAVAFIAQDISPGPACGLQGGGGLRSASAAAGPRPEARTAPRPQRPGTGSPRPAAPIPSPSRPLAPPD